MKISELLGKGNPENIFSSSYEKKRKKKAAAAFYEYTTSFFPQGFKTSVTFTNKK